MFDPARNPSRSRRKKVDQEALFSPLKRIPGFDIPAVRALIDLGVTTVDHLRGRAPEVLYELACKQNPATPRDRLYQFRLAVYYAETEIPDRALLHPSAWAD